jgi:hypothetical protein
VIFNRYLGMATRRASSKVSTFAMSASAFVFEGLEPGPLLAPSRVRLSLQARWWPSGSLKLRLRVTTGTPLST